MSSSGFAGHSFRSLLPPAVYAGAALVAGAFDLATGPSYPFLFLYVFIVAGATWHGGRLGGLAATLWCGAVPILELLLSPAAPAASAVWSAVGSALALPAVVLLTTRARSSLLRAEQAERKGLMEVLDEAGEAILMTDEKVGILTANARAVRLLELPSHYGGMDLLDRIVENDARAALCAMLVQETPGHKEMELRLRGCRGGAVCARTTILAPGAGDARRGFVFFLQDISHQKSLEQDLAQRRCEILAMQRLSSDLSQAADVTARLEIALDTVLEVTGFEAGCIYSLDEARGELQLEFCRGIQTPEFSSMAARWPVDKGLTGEVARTGIPRFVEDATCDTVIDRCLCAYEGIRAFASIPLLARERVRGVMNILRRSPFSFPLGDQVMLQTLGKQIGILLENAALYETARQREQQLRRLSLDLVQVQEEERRRFARELHDGISQLLTTLTINAEMALKGCEADIQATQRHLREVITLAHEAQSEAKEIAYDLRPSILDDFGLRAALAHHATSFERRTGIGVELHLPARDIRFGGLLETTIYRIVQELLANVARHSGATRVTMQMLVRNNILALTVADNGKGFDPAGVMQNGAEKVHFGIRNVRERVEFLGGSSRIESAPGRGTEVIVELPIPAEKAAARARKERVR